MLIAIASDHAGFVLKQTLLKELEDLNIIDLGAQELAEVDDYPDFSNLMADFISKNPDAFGILICGTGIGISMAANRHSNLRAALLHSEKDAVQSREHLNANIAVFGASNTGPQEASQLFRTFLNTKFSGEERHCRRISKMS